MTFTPTQRIFQPPASDDPMGEALVVGLHRKANRRKPWGLWRTVFGAGITLGILPLIVWPMRFLDSANFENRQLEDVLDWLESLPPKPGPTMKSSATEFLQNWVANVRGESETSARKALKRARISSAGLMQVWFVAAAIFLLMVEFFFKSGFNLRSLLRATILPVDWFGIPSPSPKQTIFFYCWAVALCFAQLLHLLHMVRHARRMKIFAKQVNLFLVSSGQESVSWQSPEFGINIPFLLAISGWVVLSGFWLIPAMVAGEYYKQYILETNTRFRRDLADRIKSIMSSNPSTPQ